MIREIKPISGLLSAPCQSKVLWSISLFIDVNFSIKITRTNSIWNGRLFFNLLFMFPRELHYILEEGMSDKHNNKVAKEIENSKGWMQVIVQIISLLQHSGTKSNKSKSHKNTWMVQHEKRWQTEFVNYWHKNYLFIFSNCPYFRCRNFLQV